MTLKGLDGASYHDSHEVQDYLNQVNQWLEEKDWKVTCIFFAPHAPDQNPVEDVWLQGKTFRSCRQIDEWGNHQDSQEGMGNALEIVCPLKHDYILSQIILVDTPEGA